MRACRLLLVLSLGAQLALASGIEPSPITDPAQEARYQNLLQELRCLVCQNQPLADSGADLAKDMRDVVLVMLQEGKTDEEIVQFMVERYGNFVRYRPPFSLQTAALWLAPFAVLVFLLIMLVRLLRRQKGAALSGDERARAKKLLK